MQMMAPADSKLAPILGLVPPGDSLRKSLRPADDLFARHRPDQTVRTPNKGRATGSPTRSLPSALSTAVLVFLTGSRSQYVLPFVKEGKAIHS